MTLAVVSVLIAAKIEQPIAPSFYRILKLVKDEWDLGLEKKTLKDLEENILCELDFTVAKTNPLFYLERYLRIFDLHLED